MQDIMQGHQMLHQPLAMRCGSLGSAHVRGAGSPSWMPDEIYGAQGEWNGIGYPTAAYCIEHGCKMLLGALQMNGLEATKSGFNKLNLMRFKGNDDMLHKQWLHPSDIFSFSL